MSFDSSLESKAERGIREALSWGISPPSDGMIEFRFKVAEGEYAEIWMTCERARTFCDTLHENIRLHEIMGQRNGYSFPKGESAKWKETILAWEEEQRKRKKEVG